MIARRCRGTLLTAVALLAVALYPVLGATPTPTEASMCGNTSIPGLTPLIDMSAAETYQGEAGRLYDTGNDIPSAHLDAAPAISPINGRIGVISLSMSNGSEEWAAFMSDATESDSLAPEIALGNGAVPGHTASDWADPDNEAWDFAVQFIAEDGLVPSAVQVVWMKMASRVSDFQGMTFQEGIEQEAGWIRQTIANAEKVFPNLKRVYVSSRIYAGYADNANHEEPTTGYHNAWSNRIVVADSVDRTLPTWVAWGPYLWANGENLRSDGLAWECSDLEPDGVHPSNSGEAKVAEMLLDFFSNDPSTCSWFLADPCDGGGGGDDDGGGGGGGLPFTDISASVFVDDIVWLNDNGITTGCNPPANDLFCANDRVSRGQLAAFLNRALDLPQTSTDFFADDSGSVFEADINELAAAGITAGCDPPVNSQFCPTDFVTRGEMAAFLARGLLLPAGSAAFVDDDRSIFEDDIAALAAAGIAAGCNPPVNSRFCPTDFVTRGEMAAFLHRAEPFLP